MAVPPSFPLLPSPSFSSSTNPFMWQPSGGTNGLIGGGTSMLPSSNTIGLPSYSPFNSSTSFSSNVLLPPFVSFCHSPPQSQSIARDIRSVIRHVQEEEAADASRGDIDAFKRADTKLNRSVSWFTGFEGKLYSYLNFCVSADDAVSVRIAHQFSTLLNLDTIYSKSGKKYVICPDVCFGQQFPPQVYTELKSNVFEKYERSKHCVHDNSGYDCNFDALETLLKIAHYETFLFNPDAMSAVHFYRLAVRVLNILRACDDVKDVHLGKWILLSKKIVLYVVTHFYAWSSTQHALMLLELLHSTRDVKSGNIMWIRGRSDSSAQQQLLDDYIEFIDVLVSKLFIASERTLNSKLEVRIENVTELLKSTRSDEGDTFSILDIDFIFKRFAFLSFTVCKSPQSYFGYLDDCFQCDYRFNLRNVVRSGDDDVVSSSSNISEDITSIGDMLDLTTYTSTLWKDNIILTARRRYIPPSLADEKSGTTSPSKQKRREERRQKFTEKNSDILNSDIYVEVPSWIAYTLWPYVRRAMASGMAESVDRRIDFDEGFPFELLLFFSQNYAIHQQLSEHKPEYFE